MSLINRAAYWQVRATLLEEALAELVRLKDAKDAGDTAAYTPETKAAAWARAREVLSQGKEPQE